MLSRRRRGILVTASLVVLGLLGYWGIDVWQTRSMLSRARRAISLGDPRTARADLVWLAAHRPGDGEPTFLLGECESSLEQWDAALLAWGNVPETSDFADAAALRRGRLALDRGRFTLAETSLQAALRSHSVEANEARESLARLYWREARFAESAALLEAHWQALERAQALSLPAALALLRGHLALDFEAFPIDTIVDELRQVAASAPEDVRVKAALARWELQAGRLDAAETLLKDCEERQVDDPVVARTRLDWHRAAQQPDGLRDVLARIPAAGFAKRDLLALRAWLAAVRGDAVLERRELESLVALDPSDLSALERLTELVAASGEIDQARRLRQKKSDLDRSRQIYQTHYKNDDLLDHLPEMVELAGQLGRSFESQAFATLASRQTSFKPGARKPPPAPSIVSDDTKATLADLLATDLEKRVRQAPAVGRIDTPRFRDDAPVSGLNFTFQSGASLLRQLPEVMCGGVGLLDYDNDGWIDVLALQGGSFPPRVDQPDGGDRLFHNNGNGAFDDVTAMAGFSSSRTQFSHGVAVGDYDNDGYADLFITRWRSYTLYHNTGNGTFEDVTGPAGLDGDRDWPTSAAFADLDGDGDLDLYVCHYLRWDADAPRICPDPAGKGNRSCDPRHFEALPDHVFRNDAGRFVDVSASALPRDLDGRGLGVSAADLDGDGRVDLFVANDGTANFLLHNLGDFRFEEIGQASGVACNASGAYQAGMGTAVGDLDGDGRVDLLVTNFYNESTTFFRGIGDGLFADHGAAIGLAAPSRSLLGFGLCLIDANNDGRLDVATANGHVNDDRPGYPYEMPSQLLLGLANGRLHDASRDAGPDWMTPRLGRGLASGDLDNDGCIDLVMVALDRPLVYFHNQSRTPSCHYLTLQLQGTRSNRDAVGAVVTVVTGQHRQRAERSGGGSYLSASAARLHFGLGAATSVDAVEVRWPSGQVQQFPGLPADRAYRLVEGAGRAEPLATPVAR